jgi:hypothetical protein
MTNSTIGLDVSKDHLDAHRLPDGVAKQFPNDAAGHKALIRRVKATPTDRIVFVATGPYSQSMESALTGAKHKHTAAQGFAACPPLIDQRPELGSIDAKQAASLAGLAPMTQASVRNVERQRPHSRRKGRCAAGALYAGARRRALQPGSQEAASPHIRRIYSAAYRPLSNLYGGSPHPWSEQAMFRRPTRARHHFRCGRRRLFRRRRRLCPRLRPIVRRPP